MYKPKPLRFFVATLLIFSSLSHINAQTRDTIPPNDGDTPIVQEYPVSLDAGEEITIQVDRISGTLQPFIGIANDEGRVIVRQSANGIGTNSLNYTAEEAGTYQIQIIADPTAEVLTYGEFVLTIERAGDSETENTAPFTANDDPLVIVSQLGTFRGAITNANPEHFYDIFMNRGTVITLELYQVTGDLNPQVAIVESTGRILARGTQEDSFSTVLFEVETSGWYRIIVTRFDPVDVSTQGDYRLEIMTDR